MLLLLSAYIDGELSTLSLEFTKCVNALETEVVLKDEIKIRTVKIIALTNRACTS